MTLFTLRDAALQIPGATVIGDENVAFDRVSTDSRTAGPGDLFIAIKGDRFDAHTFLPQVAQRGIAAALVTHTPDDFHVPAIKVKDTRVALGALAHGWR
jgi:UDP-N-acetylmuramoyl-tripeptide--D-alanyl-D-alanine ligase